ncbi:MAG TPA: hypothetical protein VFR75_01025 [Solirubrobacterales bacterium]|nr:hypothetical protein [Solirubrobacterales bacterium]
MLKSARPALLLALGAVVLATAGGGTAGAAQPAPKDPFWLGPYFAGLRWEPERVDPFRDRFIYGECVLPEGEGGCGWPLEVQNSSSCAYNPLRIDRVPNRLFLLRGGGLAAEYEPTRVAVGTGLQTTIVLPEEFELIGAALRELRRRSESAPQPLAPPVYPLPLLRELKRVTVAAARVSGIPAIARETGLPTKEVRLRLQVAELLGPEALAEVPAPKMSTATVERLERLAFYAQYKPAKLARRLGISLASLKRKISRVRGLAGPC